MLIAIKGKHMNFRWRSTGVHVPKSTCAPTLYFGRQSALCILGLLIPFELNIVANEHENKSIGRIRSDAVEPSYLGGLLLSSIYRIVYKM